MVTGGRHLAARRASAAPGGGRARPATGSRLYLLAAVGHDLRPAGHRQGPVVSGFGAGRRSHRRRTVRAAGVRPTTPSTGSPALVDNLLDLSRLQAGRCVGPAADAGSPRRRGALDDLGVRRRARWTCQAAPRPADPGLLERVIVNVVANAERTPPILPLLMPSLTATVRVDLRVIDPAPACADRDRVSSSLSSDSVTRALGPPSRTGAVLRGLTEAMAGPWSSRTTRRRADHGHPNCPHRRRPTASIAGTS